MILKKFTFTLQHDEGIVNLSTVATNVKSAWHIISNAELCPTSAIKRIVSQVI